MKVEIVTWDVTSGPTLEPPSRPVKLSSTELQGRTINEIQLC
jgi:hypothetical protein